MSGVRDIDRGWKALARRMLAKDPHVVTVGVQGDAADEDRDGIKNVRLAGVHEFGAEIETRNGVIKIPERSFVRATVEAGDGYKALIRQLANGVVSGTFKSVSHALSLLGEKVSSDMKRRIEKGIPPPNAPSTIAAKSKSGESDAKATPLIDTGQLKNSITYEVRKDGGK